MKSEKIIPLCVSQQVSDDELAGVMNFWAPQLGKSPSYPPHANIALHGLGHSYAPERRGDLDT